MPRRAGRLGRLVQRAVVVGRRADFGGGDRRQDLVELVRLGASGQVGRHLVGEDGQPHGVALLERQVRQRGRQRRGIVQLAAAGVGAAHRSAGVEQQVEVQVRVGVIFLDVEPIVPCVELPVQVAEVVAGSVLAVRGELDAQSPRYGLRCRPCIDPSTIDRARSSIESSREKKTGSIRDAGVEEHRGSGLLLRRSRPGGG